MSQSSQRIVWRCAASFLESSRRCSGFVPELFKKCSVNLTKKSYIENKARKISDGVFIVKIVTKDYGIATSIISQRKVVMNKCGGINWIFPATNEYRVKLGNLIKRKK